MILSDSPKFPYEAAVLTHDKDGNTFYMTRLCVQRHPSALGVIRSLSEHEPTPLSDSCDKVDDAIAIFIRMVEKITDATLTAAKGVETWQRPRSQLGIVRRIREEGARFLERAELTYIHSRFTYGGYDIARPRIPAEDHSTPIKNPS